MDISVVLPAHNEEENIGVVVAQAQVVLPRLCDDFEIIVVNDGSTDRTGAILNDLAAADSRIRPVHHPNNRGYGAALTSGFESATGQSIFFMDSDRQFAIAELERLLPHIVAYDIVAGYRIKRNDPWPRKIIGRTFNLLVGLLFGVKLKDIDCGFRLFRTKVLRGMVLESPGALINTEIFAKAKRRGYRVKEVGVHHYPRLVGQQSGASLKVVSRAAWETFRLWYRLNFSSSDAERPDPEQKRSRTISSEL